jgi:hypothetical protein
MLKFIGENCSFLIGSRKFFFRGSRNVVQWMPKMLTSYQKSLQQIEIQIDVSKNVCFE